MPDPSGEEECWHKERDWSEALDGFMCRDCGRKIEKKPRSLTYQEALEARRVKIDFPDGDTEEYIKYVNVNNGRWTSQAYNDFDLAERRGYPMYRVEY